MNEPTPVIEANDLRRSVNDIETVAGVGFTVKHGVIFGLLGPNGAGETTAIRG